MSMNNQNFYTRLDFMVDVDKKENQLKTINIKYLESDTFDNDKIDGLCLGIFDDGTVPLASVGHLLFK